MIKDCLNSKVIKAVFLLLIICFTGGCQAEMSKAARKAARAVYGGTTSSYEEFTGDPIAIATTKSVAFIPFDYVGRLEGFDTMTFTTRFASQMSTKGQVKVVFPRQAMKLVEVENRKVNQHNTQLAEMVMMGNDLNGLSRDERQRARKLNPVISLDDAVKIGRMLKVDAVVTGTVSEWDPYMRPRMCVNVKIIATGNSDTAAQALAQMTQWGVPRQATTARGVVWFLQQNFDTRDSDIGRNIWAYGLMKHTEYSASDIDSYLRSISQFYDYVGSVLAKSILATRSEAIEEAERRALEEAKRIKLAQAGVRRKLRALTDPYYEVPEAQAVMNQNLADKRDMSWRPDVYNLQHQDKKRLINTYVDPKLVNEQTTAIQ